MYLIDTYDVIVVGAAMPDARRRLLLPGWA